MFSMINAVKSPATQLRQCSEEKLARQKRLYMVQEFDSFHIVCHINQYNDAIILPLVVRQATESTLVSCLSFSLENHQMMHYLGTTT